MDITMLYWFKTWLIRYQRENDQKPETVDG